MSIEQTLGGNGDKETEKSAKEELAETLSRILRKLHDKLGDPAYSMLIQNAPIPMKDDEHLYRHYHSLAACIGLTVGIGQAWAGAKPDEIHRLSEDLTPMLRS